MGFWSGLADGVCWVGEKCEAGCRWGLNGVSGDSRWGDALYDDIMQPAVEARVKAMSPETIERIANIDSASDFGALVSTGLKATGDTIVGVTGEVRKTVFEACAPDLLGSLAPLGIGAGILGGAYLIADSFSGSSSQKRSH